MYQVYSKMFIALALEHMHCAVTIYKYAYSSAVFAMALNMVVAVECHFHFKSCALANLAKNICYKWVHYCYKNDYIISARK